jgi:hypothetical protein
MTYFTLDAAGFTTEYEGIPNLEQIQQAVGGRIEALEVNINGVPATMFLNEEGKLERLPVNPAATIVALDVLMDGDYIAGNVVFVGGPDRRGNSTTLPPEWIAFLRPFTREV